MNIQFITTHKTSTRKFSLPAMAVGAVSVLSIFGVAAQDFHYAKVVSVEPIVESVRVSEPVEQCWVESQPAYNSYNSHRSNGYDNNYRSNSSTPNILGVIIGGVIGNQFGSGRGKGLATVAGAVLGGSVANDIKQDNRYNRSTTSYRNVERCEVTQQQHREERIVAYDVSYRYNGAVYHTQMDRRPGDEIKVAVNVVPVR
jgi:uncharacterized protein YcfJ